MPKFNRPGSALKEKTGGGFDKPASAPERKRHVLVKEGIEGELSIDDLYINEELMDQPLLMRKYTKQLAGLKKKSKAIKNKLEMEESKLKIQFSNDGKGRKVAEIESMVIGNEHVQQLRVELYDAEEQQDEFEGLVRAIAQRYEMLKELSTNLRKELM